MRDYADSCTKIDTLRRMIYDACLMKDWKECLILSDKIVEEARNLRMYSEIQLINKGNENG